MNAYAGSGNTYIYDQWLEAVPSQSGYMVEATYNGLQLDIGHFAGPTDIFVDSRNLIYVLDPANNRVVVLDEDFKAVKVINKFTKKDGSEDKLNGSTGIFVDEEQQIYIADKANNRVLITDYDGNVLNEIRKPVSQLISEEMPFDPKRVLVDKTGVIYVIAERTTQGSLMIDKDNNFLGFYGTNKVTMTAARLYDFFRRQFMSADRRKLISSFIPIEFTSFDIDEQGFVYTVNAYSSNVELAEMVRKLNPEGKNILPPNRRLIGDEPDWSRVKVTDEGAAASAYNTNYVDITVDADGFIYALDDYNGRVFQFSQDGEQVFIFGGKSRQVGQFLTPVAVETINGKVLVLDSNKNNITVFEPTYFGGLVNDAMLMYADGRYTEALALWEEIVRMNANYDVAYSGIGNAYFEQGEFELAKANFRSGVNTIKYSNAKKEIRNAALKDNFPFLFGGVVFAAAAVLYVSGYMRRRKQYLQTVYGGVEAGRGDFYANLSKYKYPLQILRHPVDSYNEMRNNNKYSLTAANIIIGLWFLLAILRAGYVDMDYNPDVLWEGAVYLPRLFMSTVLMFALAVLSNWSFCTLMDGKGKLVNIWISSAYAMLPMVITGYIGAGLTHVLTLDEFVFISYILAIGTLWTGALVVLSLGILHEYTLPKTIASLILTLLGVAIIAFLVILMSGVYTQLYSFVMTLINEISIRLK
jgi:DNA-binding beta-propeller fold protein YncE